MRIRTSIVTKEPLWAGVLQGGQVGLYDRSYAGVDRAGAVLMGAARHEDLILSNTIHPHAIEEPVSK